jgi:hypothetical protein
MAIYAYPSTLVLNRVKIMGLLGLKQQSMAQYIAVNQLKATVEERDILGNSEMD